VENDVSKHEEFSVWMGMLLFLASSCWCWCISPNQNVWLLKKQE